MGGGRGGGVCGRGGRCEAGSEKSWDEPRLLRAGGAKTSLSGYPPLASLTLALCMRGNGSWDRVHLPCCSPGFPSPSLPGGCPSSPGLAPCQGKEGLHVCAAPGVTAALTHGGTRGEGVGPAS